MWSKLSFKAVKGHSQMTFNNQQDGRYSDPKLVIVKILQVKLFVKKLVKIFFQNIHQKIRQRNAKDQKKHQFRTDVIKKRTWSNLGSLKLRSSSKLTVSLKINIRMVIKALKSLIIVHYGSLSKQVTMNPYLSKTNHTFLCKNCREPKIN